MPYTPNQAFHSQKQYARERGIAFCFTYLEWVTWWEAQLGPNWSTLRGPKPDQFCMARKGDVGPYAPWNIECKTNAENRREQHCVIPIGEDSGRSKLTKKQVNAIRMSKLKYALLSQRYKVAQSTISRIKNGLIWK